MFFIIFFTIYFDFFLFETTNDLGPDTFQQEQLNSGPTSHKISLPSAGDKQVLLTNVYILYTHIPTLQILCIPYMGNRHTSRPTIHMMDPNPESAAK